MAVRTAPQSSPEIAKLAQKLAKDPTSKVFIQLAEEYVKAGLFQEAIGALEDGLKVFPAFVTARVALGRVYHQSGEMAKAKAMLEEAVKLSPDNLLAHRMLARLYADEKAFEAALRSCTVVLGANPKDGEIVELRRGIEEAQRQPASTTGRDDGSPATLQSASASDGAAPDSRGMARDSSGGAPAPDGRADRVARLCTLLATVQARRAPPPARRSE